MTLKERTMIINERFHKYGRTTRIQQPWSNKTQEEARGNTSKKLERKELTKK